MSSTATAPRPTPALTPAARFESRVNTPRAVAAWALAFAVLQAVYCFFVEKRLVDIVILLALQAATMRLAWQTLRTGAWQSLWSTLGLVALAFVAYRFGAKYDLQGPAWPLAVATLCCLASTAVTLLLAGLHLLRPARALIVSGTLLPGLVLLEGVHHLWRHAPPAVRNVIDRPRGASTEASPGGLVVRTTPGQQTPVSWVGSPFDPDPELGHVNRPLAMAKTYYASNERGYFREERSRGWLDMRLFLANRSGPGEVRVELPSQRRGMLRILPQPAEKPELWHLGANQVLGLIEPNVPYRLRFRARAEAPRNLEAMVQDGTRKFAALGQPLRVALTDQWQTLELDVQSDHEIDASAVLFSVGDAAIPVEIQDAWFDRADLAVETLLPEAPRLNLQQGAQGQLSFDAASGTARVSGIQSDAKVAWHVQLVYPGLSVRLGRKYRLSFEARAAQGRPMQWSVGMNHAPWGTLGCFEKGELSAGGWQRIEREFVASADEPQARALLDLGLDEGEIEVRSVTLHSGESNPAANMPRYFVEYRLNSHGMRDVERETTKPAGVVRVAMLGDSFLFGQGVHQTDLMSQRLEALLNDDPPANVLYEVLNFSSPGYSTKQQRLLFQRQVRAFQPDVVVVVMVENDDLSSEEEQQLGLYADDQGGTLVGRLLRDKLAQRQRDFQRCVEQLKQLEADCAQQSCRLVAAVFRYGASTNEDELLRVVREGLTGSSVSVLDLGETLLAPEVPRDLLVSGSDWHPNEIGHRLAAQAIGRYLIQQGLLPTRAATADAPASDTSAP